MWDGLSPPLRHLNPFGNLIRAQHRLRDSVVEACDSGDSRRSVHTDNRVTCDLCLSFVAPMHVPHWNVVHAGKNAPSTHRQIRRMRMARPVAPRERSPVGHPGCRIALTCGDRTRRTARPTRANAPPRPALARGSPTYPSPFDTHGDGLGDPHAMHCGRLGQVETGRARQDVRHGTRGEPRVGLLPGGPARAKRGQPPRSLP